MSTVTEFFKDTVDSIVNFANDLISFLYDGIIDIIFWVYSKIVQVIIVTFFKLFIFSINFGWSVAKGVIETIQLNSLLADAFAQLPGDVGGILTLMGFPEAINVIVTGVVARFAMRFIPFIK